MLIILPYVYLNKTQQYKKIGLFWIVTFIKY
jgi:hypothetical protein